MQDLTLIPTIRTMEVQMIRKGKSIQCLLLLSLENYRHTNTQRVSWSLCPWCWF